MPVASLIDADDRSIGRKIVFLLRKIVVEKEQPAVQEHDGSAVPERLRVQLRAPHFDEPMRAVNAVCNARLGCKRDARGKYHCGEFIHCAYLAGGVVIFDQSRIPPIIRN